jgi:5'-nucleotidase/UDP-sugar diphosphatase
MKRMLILIVSVLMLVPAVAEQRQLIILHTNDFHGRIKQENEFAGAARITALVNQVRENNEAVLFLNAGDSISGTPVSTLFEGIPIFEVMNMMGYDAAALGNHEFDHGFRQIEKFRDIANYPLLSINAYSPKGELLADAPLLVKDIAGIKVAIIGVITEQTPHMIIPLGNADIYFADPKEAVESAVSALCGKVDVMIVLSHVGHEEELVLARETNCIDVIVGGHSHTVVDPGVMVGQTLVVQAGEYGSHVGIIELNVDTKTNKMLSVKSELIPAKELPGPAPEVAAAVKAWTDRVADQVDYEIAKVSRDYSKEELQIILEDILADATGAEFGFYNMGGIRDVLRKGPVTARNIWTIEPFGNNLVTIRAKGSIVRRMLGKGQDDPHRRAASIDNDRTYFVATNSFIGSHVKKDDPDAVEITYDQALIRDVIIDYIKAHGLQ